MPSEPRLVRHGPRACARDALARAPAANRFPKSTKRAVRSRLFGWREILCQETRVRENRHIFFTKRVVAPSNRAFPSEKKRHLFFDENTVGAD